MKPKNALGVRTRPRHAAAALTHARRVVENLSQLGLPFAPHVLESDAPQQKAEEALAHRIEAAVVTDQARNGGGLGHRRVLVQDEMRTDVETRIVSCEPRRQRERRPVGD